MTPLLFFTLREFGLFGFIKKKLPEHKSLWPGQGYNREQDRVPAHGEDRVSDGRLPHGDAGALGGGHHLERRGDQAQGI